MVAGLQFDGEVQLAGLLSTDAYDSVQTNALVLNVYMIDGVDPFVYVGSGRSRIQGRISALEAITSP